MSNDKPDSSAMLDMLVGKDRISRGLPSKPGLNANAPRPKAPEVPNEVKEWSALIGTFRQTYTANQVKDIMFLLEGTLECTGSELILKLQDLMKNVKESQKSEPSSGT